MGVTSLVRVSAMHGCCQISVTQRITQAQSLAEKVSDLLLVLWFLALTQQGVLGVVVRQRKEDMKRFFGKGCKSHSLGSQTPSSVTSPPPLIKHRLEKAMCVQCQGAASSLLSPSIMRRSVSSVATDFTSFPCAHSCSNANYSIPEN